MIKLLGGGCAILMILLLVAGMHIRNLGLKIDNFEQREITLKDAVKDANDTTKKWEEFAISDRSRAAEYEKELAENKEISTAFKIENMRLRSTEHDEALQNPYKRGIAAGSRMRSLWMRVENNPYSGIDYFNNAPPDDSPD